LLVHAESASNSAAPSGTQRARPGRIT
jgi:hypothetical protein